MSDHGRDSHQSVSSAIIDSLEFAGARGRIEGDVAIAEMERLSDLLQGDGGGYLHCCVAGDRDADDRSFLIVKVVGEVQMRCSRCLGPLRWPISVEGRFLLVAPGMEWPDDDLAADDCDAIAAVRGMALLPLLEDEVMLGLPLSPRHDELCDLPRAVGEDHEASPFDALAVLKKKS